MDLSGKSAVVTGSSRGVGRATALALARRGCRVLINYSTSRDEAERTAAEVRALGGQAICFAGSVADDAVCRAMMDAAVREFGRLDVLVNNAGISGSAESDLYDTAAWNRLMGINATGVFLGMKYATAAMKKAGGAMSAAASRHFAGQRSCPVMAVAWCGSSAFAMGGRL